MIYIFVDTNIWVRVLTQAFPGCELKYLDALRDLIAGGKVVLVLPEVVELEVDKNWRDLTIDLAREIEALENEITQAMNKKKTWNEIEDVKKDVIGLLQAAKDKKKAHAEATYKKVVDLFCLPQVQRIELTQGILLQSRKRTIAGRMPKVDKDRERDRSKDTSNDALIVESLLAHFAKHGADDVLYFGSENSDDFALPTNEGVVLHPLVAKGMPVTKYVRTLSEMMTFYDSQAKIDEPAKEVIEKALERNIIRAERPPHTTKCAISGCRRYVWWLGPFCQRHYDRYMAGLPEEQRASFKDAVLKVLKTLTYLEREIFKLRAGWSDGYQYTREEVAHIFRMTRRQMLRTERIILRKLMQPSHAELISPFFPATG